MMSTPLSWTEWYATQVMHRMGRAAFGLTSLGQQTPANTRTNPTPEPTVRQPPHEEANARAVPRFDVGRLLVTPGALKALAEVGEDGSQYLYRHLSGDWGEVGAEDARENEFSVMNGFRILSAYKLRTGKTLWIITEADRSMTTLLTPDEY